MAQATNSEFSVLSLSSSGYDKYSSVTYSAINNGSVYLRPPFSRDLGFGYFSKLFNIASSTDIVIVHSPFMTGLMALIYYYFVNYFLRIPSPRLYFLHHAVPSSNFLSSLSTLVGFVNI